MNALERTMAVLHREKPGQVPFVPYENLVPRGDFIREMRNRGMGLCTQCTPVSWSEWPHVGFTTKTAGTLTTTTWDTPAGSVSSLTKTHLSRKVASRVLYGNAGIERDVLQEGFIKGVEDYAPVIFAIDDEIVHEDHINYEYTVRDYRSDCLVRVAGPRSPYYASRSYYYDPLMDGGDTWLSAQSDHPDHFAQLLQALERREERRLEAIADAPGEVMYLEGIGGSEGPQQFEKYQLPFFQKVVPLLHERGKVLSLKVETASLKDLKDLIPQTGVDVIEGFIPPPVGDLSIAEARAAWGDSVVIWVGFPESIFGEGAKATKKYTLDLLRSDPSGAVIIGLTGIGTSRIADEETAQVFRAGMSAIMDAIEEFGSP